MHISFSPEHEAFREEVRAFLDDKLTTELKQANERCPGMFMDYEFNMTWHKILYEKGWVAPAWPREYGGTGWDLTQRYIWTTETTLAGAPATMWLGVVVGAVATVGGYRGRRLPCPAHPTEQAATLLIAANDRPDCAFQARNASWATWTVVS